jgi:hypothetical protein
VNAKHDGAFTAKEIEEAVKDLPTYKAGDSDELKSELIKAGGTAMETVLLQLFNWLWTGEVMPTAWSQVIVNLFKAGDTQQPGNYRGITLVSICRKMFTNILRKRLETTVALHEAQAAFRSKRSCADQQFVLARWTGEVRLERRCTFFFWTCAKPMTLCGGMASSTSSSRKG